MNKHHKPNVNDLVDFFMSKGNSIEEIVNWLEVEMEKLKFEILVEELKLWDDADAQVDLLETYDIADNMLKNIINKK
jgi:hypothetical protein